MKHALLSVLSSLILIAAAPNAEAQGMPYDECGDVVAGVTCLMMFSDQQGRLWLPDTFGTAQLGDHIRITGLADMSCSTICQQGDGCIFNATVLTCGGIDGTSYCISTPNSTGSAALISASGTDSVVMNNLVLAAAPVPNQPGLFFYGQSQIQAPFGNGFQCVGAPIQRLFVENAVGNVLTHALDNTIPPNPSGLITPGSTWNFQAWFRDPTAGGSFFNLSDGISITFSP